MISEKEHHFTENEFAILNNAITKELSCDEIYLNHICLKNNKEYCALKAFNNIAVKIMRIKNEYSVEFKTKYSKYLLDYQIESKNEEYSSVTFLSIDDIASISKNLCSIAIEILSDNCGESFGCCSRYLECSNE